MAGRVALLLVFLSLLLASWTSVSHAQAEICDRIPWNSENGDNPLQPYRGKVVVVALMLATCTYCTGQASLMQALNERLQPSLPDIQMIIVNAGTLESRDRINNLRNRVTFPVLQDDVTQPYLFTDVFVGAKDDIIIYDRCGQKSFRVPLPYSDIRNGFIERLIRRTYQGFHFCYCHRDPPPFNPYNTMFGDAPSSSNGNAEIESAAAHHNFFNCSDTDILCQRFRRIFNRRNRGPGIGQAEDEDGPRFEIFTDQSDFDLGTAGNGISLGTSMGSSGSGVLQSSHLPAGRRPMSRRRLLRRRRRLHRRRQRLLMRSQRLSLISHL